MSKKILLDAARTSFKKIMEIAQNMRKGKKDRRATPPKGGDGRSHDQRTKVQEKPDISKDSRVGSHEAFLQEQEMKKFADSRVEMEKLWDKHLKKGKNINN